MYRKIWLVVIMLSCNVLSYNQLNGQDSVLKDCYCTFSADTVIIGNRLIERQWLWRDGILLPLSMTKKSGTVESVFSHTEKELERLMPEEVSTAASSLKMLSKEVSGTSFSEKKMQERSVGKIYMKESSRIIASTAVSGEKLVCELIADFPGYQKKIEISVSPGIPAVKIASAFRRIGDAGLPTKPESGFLDRFFVPSLNYNVTTVEFFDQTDGHNNLVEKDFCLPFRSRILKRGNLLLAKANTGHISFFLLKEAPCSSVQLHYQGWDFLIQGTQYAVGGSGLSAEDLIEGEWISTYSAISGVPLDGFDIAYSLRLYQKSIRKHDPDRDDMIMLNTWGDRNRDQSINEDFCMREIDACKKYGFTHFQIDDGWQTGLSSNSGSSAGKLWDEWEAEHWQPNPNRFPNGFQVVVDYAKKQGISMGLWFHPSNTNGYEKWKRDAMIVENLYLDYGIRYFKIDGIKLPDKVSEVNFRKFLNLATELSDGNIVFNLDATANRRGGYHFLNEFGNIFLENRYTDWRNYFPHWTLRNLWQLSEYVPPEKLQVEFLNTWRNSDRYDVDDPLAPPKVPFEYAFAITMAAQPLAWFEASNLPAEAEKIIPIVEQYRKVWHQFHKGYIFPVGQEPNGTNWTGFQSVQGNSGYFLVFREMNEHKSCLVKTLLQPGKAVSFKMVAGDGVDFETTVNENGEVEFTIGKVFGFGFYKYYSK